MTVDPSQPFRYPRQEYRGNTPDMERRQIVVGLYEKGLPAAAVAAQVGITRQAVLRMLKRAGVTRRPRGGNTGGHSRHAK